MNTKFDLPKPNRSNGITPFLKLGKTLAESSARYSWMREMSPIQFPNIKVWEKEIINWQDQLVNDKSKISHQSE